MNISYNLNNMSPWYEDMLKNSAESSRDVASRPYIPYRGPRLSPFTAPMLQAHRLGQQTGIQNPYINRATDFANRAGSSYANDYKSYMSPYTQNVVDEIGRQGERTFRERILPALESQFVGLGHHGSSQHQDLARRASRDVMAEIAAKQGTALQQGYQQNAQIYSLEKERQASLADMMSKLGQRSHAAHLADIESLQNVGEQQRGYNQENLNIAHQDFVNSQNYPRTAINQHAALINGMPYSQHAYDAQSSQSPYQQQLFHERGPGQLNNWGRAAGLASLFSGALNRKRGGAITNEDMGKQSFMQSSFIRQPKVGAKRSLKRVL